MCAQVPTVDNNLVPNYDQTFPTEYEAFEFYRVYASLAGFGIRKNRVYNKKQTKQLECNFAGTHTKDPGPDRQRNKTSKKKQCRAQVHVTRAKQQDGTERYESGLAIV